MKYKLCRYEVSEYCPVPIKWSDSKNYPKADDLTAYEWAWEFLRRNPEYIKDWEHFNQLPDYAKIEDGQTTNKIGKCKGNPYSEFTLDCFYSNPPALPGEKMEDYEERMLEQGKNDYVVMPYIDYLYDKYKIIGIVPDPSAPLPRDITFTDEFGKDEVFPLFAPNVNDYLNSFNNSVYTEDQQNYQFIEACKREYNKSEWSIGLIFDPLKPIDEQLKVAKQVLQDDRERLVALGFSKEGNKKPRFLNFPKYIQVLDAVEQIKSDTLSKKFDVIASEIMPHKDNAYPNYSARDSIKKIYAAAKKLRDYNYWLIPKT